LVSEYRRIKIRNCCSFSSVILSETLSTGIELSRRKRRVYAVNIAKIVPSYEYTWTDV
jgi:hypothetical protein